MSDVADALEEAARRLEQRAGNPVYQKAWKVGARMIRELKVEKLTCELRKLTDNDPQIGSR